VAGTAYRTDRRPRCHAMGLGARLFTAIWLMAILATPLCAVAQPSPRAVLIVDESEPGSPFSSRFNAQIHATLDAETAQPYAIYAESLDFGHFGGTDYDAVLRTYFVDKYRAKPLSVVVVLGSSALEFLTRTRSQIWPDVPLVFAAFDGGIARASLPANATGTIAPRRLQDLVKSARVLVPKLARIALVGEQLERQPFREHYRRELAQLVKEVDVIDLTGLPLAEIKTRVASLPDDAAIVYIPIYIDGAGISHNPAEALTIVAAAANRPIVVDSDSLIGLGAGGGSAISAEDLGREAGRMVARILNGERATDIPIAVKDLARPIFDARQLKRWGVSEIALADGSELRFREPNAWERYRWQILAIAGVLAIQSLLIAWLLYEHRRREAAEGESRLHLLEVTQMDRAVTMSAMSTSIAHEINQPLSAILSNAEAAEMILAEKSPDLNHLKEIVADIRRDDLRAVDIIKHLRALLKQDEIDGQIVDLSKVLNDTLEIVRPQAAEHGVAVDVKAEPASMPVRADSVHLQQVLINLAMNAIDAMQNVPASKRMLALRINRQDDEVMVSVADTGEGIAPDKLNSIFEPFVTTKEQGTGLGLSIARTIIGRYGGRIWAENRPEGGAIFRFTLNLAEAQRA